MGALVGAKVVYLITILPQLIEHAAELSFYDWMQLLFSGGMVFYGGLYGGLFMAMRYCRRYGADFRLYGSFFAPLIPLFHAFGRVGCFLAGCCWGVECGWGVVYTESLSAPNGVSLLPIQLIESACLLALFVALLLIDRSQRRRQRERVKTLARQSGGALCSAEGVERPGLPLLHWYLFLYALLRFTLEFFRGDAIRGVWLLSTSQWIALLTLIGLAVFDLPAIIRKQPKKAG